MKFNRVAKTIVATTSALAFVVTAASSVSAAGADKKAKEKCYGVVAKGMNDCGTSSHGCAGQSKADNDAAEWVYVAKGLCERITGGNTAPTKS